MTVCPYCRATYNSTYPPPELSSRQKIIYDTVASVGPRGVPVRSLLTTVYGDNQPKTARGVLRVNIFELNRKLKEKGQKIKGRKGVGYVLVGDNVE